MKSTMTQLLERGMKKGRAEGIETGKLEDTRAMLRKGYSPADIIEITGLTEEQLRNAGNTSNHAQVPQPLPSILNHHHIKLNAVQFFYHTPYF